MNISVRVRAVLLNLFTIARKINMLRYSYRTKKDYTDKKVLTKQQQKMVKDYYSKYKNISLLFHCFYTEKTGIFSEKYIPDSMYYTDINHYFNNHQLAQVIDNKAYYDILFQDFLQPVLLATRRGDYWFIGRKNVSFEEVLNVICEENCVFVKMATQSCGGGGVRCFEKSQNSNYKQDIINFISHTKGDLVLQRCIIQHKDISKLNETSVNTIRILSVLRNGQVKIYSSVLRIGGKNSKVDNFSSGGMATGISDAGQLKEYAYYGNGERITSHPASGVVFKDYQIPSFDKAKEMVLNAHYCVPHFKMVSWDIAIREDGEPILIEANLSDGELDFHQLNNGPLFGNDTEEILNEIFKK